MQQCIKGFEGLYSIFSTGEIYTHRYNKVMKPLKHTGGYHRITLIDKYGTVHQRYIHRLVAETFIPSPDGLPLVGHRGDEDKTDNSVKNLYWCTNSENARDAHLNKRTARRRNYGSTLQRSDKVIEDAYRFYLKCGNITQTAKQFDMSRTTLSSIVNKRCRVALTDKIDRGENR
jgi:hypothetical protein